MKHGTLCIALLHLQSVVLSLPARAQVSFFQPPSYSGSGDGFVADFNRDGKTDLLTSDGTMNLGNGDGTFTAGAKLSGTVLAVADFNGDGKPDVLEQGSGMLLVLLGNGDGTFQTTPVSTPIAASLGPLAAADLNNDGKTDVVGVVNGALLVYLGKGDGTFAAPVSYSLGSYSWVLSVGDFNGDHKTDVVVSTGIPNGIAAGQEIVFLGNGDGTFQAPKTSAGVNAPLFGAVGDFNGDGKLDLAINECDSIYGCLVSVLLGNGDGTFQPPTRITGGTPPSEGTGPLAVGDFNGDGRTDFVVQDDTFVVSDVGQIYLGNADGSFSNASNYVLRFFGGPSSTGIAVADFNGDGKLDVAIGGNLLLGNGNGTFQGVQFGVVDPFSEAEVIGKFDKNGAPGAAVLAYQNVYILRNNGSGLLSPTQTYTVQQPGHAMVTADFNGDGNLDLVVVGTDFPNGDWNYSVLLGNADGTFQPPVFYPQSVQTNALGYSVVVGDFNNDGKLDIATTLYANGPFGNQTLALLLGNGDGTFAAPSYVADAGASSLVSADFNHDGKLDIAGVAPNPSTKVLSTEILFGNGDGTFQNAVFPANLSNFAVQFTADLNNDGKPDLISSSQVALGNGDGTFTVLPSALSQVSAIADFNGDGKPDLLGSVNGLQNQSGVLLGNGDGTFGSLINVPATGALPATILIADMNSDGNPDIVFPWGSSVRGIAVLLNTTPPGFEVSPASGSPTSQTITAGQTASFTLVLAPTESFTGTVNLSCAITPVVSPAPTCSLSSSSVQIRGKQTQPVTVKVATTAATTGTAFYANFPPEAKALTWFLMLLCSMWLWMRSRQRPPALATPIVVLAFVFSAGCGGSGSAHHTIPGTPAGTYTVTITASSGSVSHTLPFTVVVQ